MRTPFYQKLNALGFKTYNDFLKSDHWAEKKKEFYSIRYKPLYCDLCGGFDGPWNVHHKSYVRLGRERAKKDLILLCQPCHYFTHQLEKELNTTLWHIVRIYKKHKRTGKKLNWVNPTGEKKSLKYSPESVLQKKFTSYSGQTSEQASSP